MDIAILMDMELMLVKNRGVLVLKIEFNFLMNRLFQIFILLLLQ